MKTIDISSIRINGGTQSRAAINKDVVAEYAEAMEGGATFPPVIVFYDGADYWLADGFHRYEAYARARANKVPADVRQGTQREAILYSVGANASHGLRRTNDDKRRAVMVLLNDPEWAAWSDREIARQCGVSPSFVGGQRSASVHNGQIAETRTVTRSGKTYEQNTAKIGSTQKAECAPASTVDHEEPAPDPEPMPEAEPTDAAEAKLRRDIARMTPEAMIDEIIGLRAELSDVRAEKAKSDARVAELESWWRAANEGTDSGRALSAAAKQVKTADARMKEHMAVNHRLEKQLKAVKAERDALRKQIENEMIPLD